MEKLEIEEISERMLKNLLAVLHRDGGHHTAEVGLTQSVEDAIERWAQDRRRIDALETQLKQMGEDEQIFRQMLWMGHGHTGMYGDDGEMQCGECWKEYGFWDWKRTPIGEIQNLILFKGMK